MASVTFPIALGGDGSTVTDDANTTTGLANGGHRARFVPALSQTVVMAGTATDKAAAAAISEFNALSYANAAFSSASGLIATSTSSVGIGAGSKTLTIESGKSFAPGMLVRLYNTADNYIDAMVTAYNATTGAMTVNALDWSGTGTAASWSVTITSSVLDSGLPTAITIALS